MVDSCSKHNWNKVQHHQSTIPMLFLFLCLLVWIDSFCLVTSLFNWLFQKYQHCHNSIPKCSFYDPKVVKCYISHHPSPMYILLQMSQSPVIHGSCIATWHGCSSATQNLYFIYLLLLLLLWRTLENHFWHGYLVLFVKANLQWSPTNICCRFLSKIFD